jgi:hypothetical protein
MSGNRAQYLLRGTLRVAARGYWYTRGGEKGSFGHCMHLKDRDALPVYPDTQIYGDLRAAARWALKLGLECPGSLFGKLFGKEGSDTASLLHVGDLTLAGADRDKWNPRRFQVKPRIEIDDATRSVRDKMLVSFEAAWLDGLLLEAPLYAGYLETKETWAAARDLLTEAARLLSGFGAFRSRGFGRGEVLIVWEEPETAAITAVSAPPPRFRYYLEGLVNVRNKPVAAEKLQLVGTSTEIGAGQVRGWFIRTFRSFTGRWPDAQEMAGITFSDLYPAGKERVVCYPAPMTTLRKEDGSSIDDYWNKGRERDDNDENFVQCKLKPLRRGECVTADGRVVAAGHAARMRNAMGDDFRTLEERGLFTQQYLERGTVFGGAVHIHDPESDFGKLAYGLLAAIKPTINGSLFAPTLEPDPAATAEPGKPWLVVSPLPFDPARINPSGSHGITLDTQRRYSAVLGRPRRGRPVVAPGSILAVSQGAATFCWRGFGRKLQADEPTESTRRDFAKPVVAAPLEGVRDWKKITRSQAGILREMLNPDHDVKALKSHLAELEQKHREKENSDFAVLYSELNKKLEEAKHDGFVLLVRRILEYLQAEVWWPAGKGKRMEAKGGEAR